MENNEEAMCKVPLCMLFSYSWNSFYSFIAKFNVCNCPVALFTTFSLSSIAYDVFYNISFRKFYEENLFRFYSFLLIFQFFNKIVWVKLLLVCEHER